VQEDCAHHHTVPRDNLQVNKQILERLNIFTPYQEVGSKTYVMFLVRRKKFVLFGSHLLSFRTGHLTEKQYA
jgi:hypothetical protein